MKFEIFNITKKDSPFLSLTCLLIGILVLSLQDALIKLVSVETSFWQLQFLRSLFNLFFLFLIVSIIKKKEFLFPNNWKPVYLRACTMTLCMFCFFSASPVLSISQMAAGLYTFPIFVTVLSIIFSREIVGFWRLLALIIGASGSILVLEPWKNNFQLLQLLPISAGFFYACNIILIRKFCRNESPISLTFAVGVMFFLSGFLGILILEFVFHKNDFLINMPFVTVGWPDLTIFVLMFAIFCSVLNVLGNLSLSKAYQNAESSWLAPLDYLYLLFACFWGKLIFDVWPSMLNLLGIALIAFAGILIAYREKLKS